MGRQRAVDITPDKSLIQKLGLAGYRTEQAIAELIDNSIDARLPGRGVKVRVRLDFVNLRIAVEDDGAGMGADGLARAMTVARGSKAEGRLGRFGMGMKSACSALGRRFAVTTAPAGSGTEYEAAYDERAWLEDDSAGWSNFGIAERQLPEDGAWHGTRIDVTELHVPLYPNQVSKFKESFGVRYAPYLKSGDASIAINTVSCRPVEPDVVDGSRRDVDIPVGIGNRLVGHVALLKRRSVRGNYGIHLFKNGRLIRPFEKFGFAAHPESSRIVGELSMDHVPVRFDKTGFITESRHYADAERAFRECPAVVGAVRMSRSSGTAPPSIESLLGYFAGTSPPGRLGARIRAEDARNMIRRGAECSATIDGRPVSVSVGSAPVAAPYSVAAAEGGGASISINAGSPAFRCVRNPALILGLAVAEARLLISDPGAKAALDRRDAMLSRFLDDWSAPADGGMQDRRLRDVSRHNLSSELVEVHDHLVENYEFKFQFTALSVLFNRLHTFVGRPVYALYTTPRHGTYLADIISEEFSGRIAVAYDPDQNTLDAIWASSDIRAIIAVREYAEIPGSTVAAPEKAWVDMVNESSAHGTLDDLELRRLYGALKRWGEIDEAKVLRYARHMKKAGSVEALIGAQ